MSRVHLFVGLCKHNWYSSSLISEPSTSQLLNKSIVMFFLVAWVVMVDTSDRLLHINDQIRNSDIISQLHWNCDIMSGEGKDFFSSDKSKCRSHIIYGGICGGGIFWPWSCHFILNFEGWFRGLFQMYDLNGVYHEKADVGWIPKMW